MFWVEGKAWAEACKSKCECVFRSDCSRPPNREVGQEVTWRVWAGTRLERTGKPFSIVFTSCCKKWEVGNYLEQVGQDWTQRFRNVTLVKFSHERMESEFAIRGLLQQCRWEKVEPCLTVSPGHRHSRGLSEVESKELNIEVQVGLEDMQETINYLIAKILL